MKKKLVTLLLAFVLFIAGTQAEGVICNAASFDSTKIDLPGGDNYPIYLAPHDAVIIPSSILSASEIPEEFSCINSTNKRSRQMVLKDNNNIYIAVQYGPCPSSGYKVSITGVFESNGIIHVCTALRYPKPQTITLCVITYPYVVFKIPASNSAIKFHNNIYVDFATTISMVTPKDGLN